MWNSLGALLGVILTTSNQESENHKLHHVCSLGIITRPFYT